MADAYVRSIAEGQAAGLVVEGNPERLDSVEFSEREGFVAETKRCSVKNNDYGNSDKNRLVPNFDINAFDFIGCNGWRSLLGVLGLFSRALAQNGTMSWWNSVTFPAVKRPI